MKTMKRSIIFLMIMSISIYSNELADALINAKYESSVRVGYQSNQIGEQSDNEIAVGLKLHMETASYYSLQVGATLFTSQGNGKENFEGVPFFDENNDNYATLAEAYLKGTYSNTTFIIGRQTLETPFADSDDVGMVPNTFEAFTLINKDIPDTTLFFSQVQKWSGVDSDAPSSFTEINGNDGVQILGLTYEGVKNTTFSGWFYNINKVATLTYLEANYEGETDSLTYGITAQYALQDYDDATRSTIYGLSGSLGLKSTGLTASIAYNKTDGRAAENFFGGGPFVSNAEHHTLSEAGHDGDDILYTLEWDASVIGLEGLVLTANADVHSNGTKDDANEYDLIATYKYNDSLNFSAIYSDIDDREDSFKNLRVFANYIF